VRFFDDSKHRLLGASKTFVYTKWREGYETIPGTYPPTEFRRQTRYDDKYRHANL